MARKAKTSINIDEELKNLSIENTDEQVDETTEETAETEEVVEQAPPVVEATKIKEKTPLEKLIVKMSSDKLIKIKFPEFTFGVSQTKSTSMFVPAVRIFFSGIVCYGRIIEHKDLSLEGQFFASTPKYVHQKITEFYKYIGVKTKNEVFSRSNGMS